VYLYTLAELRLLLQTRVAALDILSDLIAISASPLRPLSQHIQNLAVGLLCAWSQNESLLVASRSAARLLGNVYIVAGKAQAGQSWRRTVESICGSIHILLNTLASTTMEGDHRFRLISTSNLLADLFSTLEQGLSANLPPLEMPPIASTSSSSGPNGQAETLQVAFKRLQALVNVLILMLAYVSFFGNAFRKTVLIVLFQISNGARCSRSCCGSSQAVPTGAQPDYIFAPQRAPRHSSTNRSSRFAAQSTFASLSITGATCHQVSV
jgi:hypothetical protein